MEGSGNTVNKKKNRGMTMVEIIVAFVMLTIVMAILYSCIQFASNLMKTAADIDRNNQQYVSAVGDKFKKNGCYELGTVSNVTYRFKGVNDDGTASGVKCDVQVYTANVAFEKVGDIYKETTSTSGDTLRRLYLFSTGGEGSSSSDEKPSHTLTYMIMKEGESGFTVFNSVAFTETVGVSEALSPAAPEGYAFDGWYYDPTCDADKRAANVPSLTKTTKSDITLYGRYVLQSSTTSYTIKYMLQKPNMGNEFDTAETVVVSGVTPASDITLVSSQINSYPGFRFDNTSSVTSAVVNAEGTTEFVLYYMRNTYVLSYVINYSDGMSHNISLNYTYGAYSLNGDKITELLSTDAATGKPVTGWYTNSQCTGEVYTLSMLESAVNSVTLYTNIEKEAVTGGVGVHNMEEASDGDKFSQKLPKMNEVSDEYKQRVWAGFGPYDNGESYHNYEIMRDSINNALADFGYNTGNVYISCIVNGNQTKLFVIDPEFAEVPDINADMTKDQIAEIIAGAETEHYSTRIAIPKEAVAVYETTKNTYADGGYDWQKINENNQLYLDVRIDRGKQDSVNWTYWNFDIKASY